MKTEVATRETTFKNVHQELIDGCKAGDQKAQFQIYRLYYKVMYNICLRIINDSRDAEDIMQESFLSAFENIEAYSGTIPFSAWLQKTVLTRALEFSKNRNRFVF
jgi:RNA polymerase sigma factor (sigma-70 family)